MRRFLFLIAVAAPLAAAAPALAQERYIGEVMVTASNFCPRGTTPADGRELQIAQYQALYSLLGTLYGGDGQRTFALPDLRGRSPVGAGRSLTTAVDLQPGQRVEGAPAPQPPPAAAMRNVDPALDATPDPDAPPVAGAGLGMLHCIVVEGFYPARN